MKLNCFNNNTRIINKSDMSYKTRTLHKELDLCKKLRNNKGKRKTKRKRNT